MLSFKPLLDEAALCFMQSADGQTNAHISTFNKTVSTLQSLYAHKEKRPACLRAKQTFYLISLL